MKMKSLVLVYVAVSALATAAFAAGGVEMHFAADASHVQIQSVELGSKLIGVKEEGFTNEGPITENIYGPALEVTVTYQSTDTADLPASVDGESNYDAVPTRFLTLDVSNAEIAAIKAGKLDPRSLVSLSVAKGTIKVEDPSYEYQCNYDNDSNQKIDDGCVEKPVPMVDEAATIVTVDRK